MNGPTPDQLRKTEAARDSVERYWYADGKTKELRRRPLTGGVARFLNFFWKKRHTVWEFYWWIRYRQGGADMAPLGNPINSDNMPIAGFPLKYELQGGWTIPKDDLKYLMKGPLAAEGLKEVLVPHALGWQRIVLLFKQFGPVVSGAIAIIGTVLRYWAEILSLVSGLANAF